MKKSGVLMCVFCLLNLCFIQAQPIQIVSFDELMNNLNSGEKVRIVIHYQQCKLNIDGLEQKSSPDAVSGLDIGTFEYFAPGVANNKMAFVVFSESKLIKNPGGKGYVYNYGKVRINSDNSVKITAQYLDSKKIKVIMDESFDCEVNNSKNFGGVYLYK